MAEANVTWMALCPCSFFGVTVLTRTGFADTGFGVELLVPEC
jgi:hypothetical protein